MTIFFAGVVRAGLDSISRLALLLTLALLWLFFPLAALAQSDTAVSTTVQSPAAAVQSVESDTNAVSIVLANGLLRIQPCAASVAHVTFTPEKTLPNLSNPWILDSACHVVPFSTRLSKDSVDILTADLTIAVDRTSGAVRFANIPGSVLLRETDWPYPRKMTAVTTDGEATHRAETWFALTPDEHFYGLGQHQNGILNQRTLEMELSQDNTNISVPFFLSSKGYGVLWNNGSVTRWNNRFQPVLAMESNVADAVDYYFIYGPDFDRIIAGYRTLTGGAPLFPRWAYGFWQSKLAYSSQAEVLDIAARYRNLGLPLDAIVLDAGWESVVGSRVFTPRFPDARGMVKTLHDENVHLMVSIWPLFQPGSTTFDAMEKNGFFVTGGVNRIPSYDPGTRLYDAFNPAARQLYWQQVKSSLYDIGVDAFWMDSTEPGDLYSEAHGPMLAGATTALGNGSKYANAYPLMTTAAIYDGQRSAPDPQRVFTLTRSAFLGMQRNAAAAWSGDIATNFDTLRREIPAGLNYSLSGFPYWTTDIGGFLGGDTSDPRYRELFVRWFQYGSFCPVFRVHGTRSNNENELWSDGQAAQLILAQYDRLRYRMLPYIYTLAARTTLEGYTPMRALAFDFRYDGAALDKSDEFMLGPSLLAAPVTEAGAEARNVYLPAGTDWIDFWTGERVHGGESIRRETPLAIMPVYVRAGSILPMGPELEYASQKPADPIELRIYPGNDGSFRLYEDDGTTYAYEKGAYSWIPMQWDDASRTLSIGAREGQFPGMLTARTFQVVVVHPGHGVGESTTAGRTVTYAGAAVQVQIPAERPIVPVSHPVPVARRAVH
ncbi:MAG TPA: TIM-barrel domain-containing protein [Acidobacteriaceae bacterium]|jgi:alpha-D-xyloside xylohydrolase